MAKKEEQNKLKSLTIDKHGNLPIISPNTAVEAEWKGLSHESLERIRSYVTVNEVQESSFNEGMLGRGYICAKRCKSGSLFTIAKNMGLPYYEFRYYYEHIPEFSAIIQQGLLDGKAELEEELTNTLYSRATGVEVSNTKVRTEEFKDGDTYISRTTTTTYKQQIPPDVTASIELLKKINPEWRPKATLDVNSTSLNVDVSLVHDVNEAIDLRKLSPDTIKSLLSSGQFGPNFEALKQECGGTVSNLNPPMEIVAEMILDDEPKIKKTRKRKPKVPPLPDVDLNVFKKMDSFADDKATDKQVVKKIKRRIKNGK